MIMRADDQVQKHKCMSSNSINNFWIIFSTVKVFYRFEIVAIAIIPYQKIGWDIWHVQQNHNGTHSGENSSVSTSKMGMVGKKYFLISQGGNLFFLDSMHSTNCKWQPEVTLKDRQGRVDTWNINEAFSCRLIFTTSIRSNFKYRGGLNLGPDHLLPFGFKMRIRNLHVGSERF